MAKILVTSEYFCKFCGKAKQMLIDAGHTVVDNPYGHTFLTPDKIIPHIGDADAIICDLEKINKDVLDAAKNLKIVARRGVGVDSVDVEECKRRNIEVARTVGLVEKPVAELVMAYILEFSRRISPLNADMHKGVWEKLEAHSLFGKTLGVVGFGNIAKEVVKRAKSFDMNVIYYDVFRNKAKEREMGVEYAELDELLKVADFVTLHVPLLDSTKNLIDRRNLKKMKKSAYLINTARGGILNESDVAEAVKNGDIAGAAIDVFEKEPTTDSPLKEAENVIITPHVATFTIETFIAMDERSAQNIIDYFNKEK